MNKQNHKRVILIIVLLISAPFVWNGLGYLIAADKGLDFTDEGLYLLAAKASSLTEAVGFFPFGWQTGFLFKLVNYDIGYFRTIGALILLCCGIALGLTISRFAFFNQNESAEKSLNYYFNIAICSSIGAMGCLLYYSGFLRTPGYNWVNLVGIIISLIGLLGIIRIVRIEKKCLLIKTKVAFYSLIAGFGMFYSFPGKPSTIFITFGLIIFLFVIIKKKISAYLIILLLSISVIFWIFVSLLIGWWDIIIFKEFIDLNNKLASYSDSHSIRIAVINTIRAPAEFYQSFHLSSITQHTILVTGFLLLASSIFTKKYSIYFQLSGYSLLILLAMSIAMAIGIHKEAVNRWLFVPIVTASIFIYITTIILYSLTLVNKSLPVNIRRNLTDNILISLYIAALPFVFSFGSGHGSYRQSFMAVCFFIIASAFLINTSYINKIQKNLFLMLILIYTAAVFFTTYIESYQFPYRNTPIAKNVSEIKFGSSHKSLYLDSETAETINHFLSQANASGWKSGTPVISVLWRWSSTVPFLLDAKVPWYNYPTIFGWPGSVGVARFNLENRSAGFPLDEAWVLIDDPERLSASDWFARWDYGKKHHDNRVEQVTEVLGILEQVSGRKFPGDYDLAVGSGPLQLWKPKANP
jgi:hypothetical protein